MSKMLGRFWNISFIFYILTNACCIPILTLEGFTITTILKFSIIQNLNDLVAFVVYANKPHMGKYE